MENKVLQRPTPNATLPRNGFDRGFEIKYNFSSAMALPVFCEPVLGETKMRINRKCIFRAAQLQTAAMVRNSYNIDFFFVPFRQLWSYYGFARTGTRDYNSSKLALADNVSLQNLPRFTAGSSQVESDLYKMLEFLNLQSGSENNPDMHGFPADRGCERLLDLLNYGVNCSFDPTQVEDYRNRIDSLPSMSPFKLCAYQKVWYDHYRLTNYVANNPVAYNLDDLVNTNGSTNAFSSAKLAALGTMHYVPYRKDYFQNIYPSLNYAPANQMSASFFKVPNNVVGASYTATTNVNSSTMTQGVFANDSVPSPFVRSIANNTNAIQYVGAQFTAQSIRALFALDKMTRLAAYAPKHVADQFEARFGFRPKGEDMNESVRIGSFVNDISIGEVLSTVDSAESPLGKIGGRAYSVANYDQDIEYTAPEDGIIIGIGYALPRISYDAGGIDDFNTIITSSGLPQPEFMDLGLEPMRHSELYWCSEVAGDIPAIREWNNRIFGYKPMYSSWKIGRDRNHGLFVYGMPLSIFSTHTKFSYTDLAGNVPSYGDLADGVDARFFYADPRDLNPLFANAYNGLQINDQFFGMIQFKFDVVQNLSVHGQPRI